MKIVFIGMIKNESKIIRRCLENLSDFVEAFCITDTGSTDDTIDVCESFFQTKNKPYKIFSSKTGFVDFGTNRTESFNVAKAFVRDDLQWDLETTYGLLLDADMNLVVEPGFDREIIKDFDEVKIKQCLVDVLFEYYNTRLVKFSKAWVCRGVTHEYWDVDIIQSSEKSEHKQCVLQTKLWINDVADGGCKANKFERDIRLLCKALEEEQHPLLKSRYMFYLAQSYLNIEDWDKAIEFYKKRIEYQGWDEEVWSSTFYIAIALSLSKKASIDDIEEWCLKAIKIKPYRAEPYFLIASQLYINKQYKRAWKYVLKSIDLPVPSKDLVNIDKNVYVYSLKVLKILLMNELYPEDDSVLDQVMQVLNIDSPKEHPELLGFLTTRIKPLKKTRTVIVPLTLNEIMNLGIFTENGTTTELLINNSLIDPVGKRSVNFPEDIRLGFYNNKLYYINSENNLFSAYDGNDIPVNVMDGDILHIKLKDEEMTLLKEGKTITKTLENSEAGKYIAFLNQEVIAESDDVYEAKKVSCKLSSVITSDCTTITLDALKITLKALYIDSENNFRLLQSPKVFGKVFKDFACFIPAVVYQEKLYFCTVTVINRVAMHCFVKTDRNLNVEGFSRPFYLETPGLEQIISFTITNKGEITVLYSSENVIKLSELSEPIDKLVKKN